MSQQTELTVTELEPNLHLVELGNRRLYLVGTAHVSSASVELARRSIAAFKPDTVALELCESRFEAISKPERWRDTDIFQVIRSGKGYVLFTQLALSGYQKKLAKELQIRPGEEMLSSIELAKQLGIGIANVDRDIRITLKRAWAKLSTFTLIRLFVSLFASLLVTEKVSAEEIEQLKESDSLSSLLGEFSKKLPDVKEVLIDERDRYLAFKLANLDSKTTVAILGAGHIPGILSMLGKVNSIADLERIPPPNKSLSVIAWSIPILVIVLILAAGLLAGPRLSLSLAGIWFLANGIPAAIGASIALAHPLTILSAFLAAPFTSLSPAIAAGWVAGLVEALVRKPRVKDLDNLAEDITSLGGFWRNRVTKVLLVMALANLGSILGTTLGLGKMAVVIKGSI